MVTSDIIIILCILIILVLFYLYNNYPETYKIVPSKTTETSYCDIDIVDSKYTKLKSRKIFCFVLFKNAVNLIGGVKNKMQYGIIITILLIN